MRFAVLLSYLDQTVSFYFTSLQVIQSQNGLQSLVTILQYHLAAMEVSHQQQQCITTSEVNWLNTKQPCTSVVMITCLNIQLTKRKYKYIHQALHLYCCFGFTQNLKCQKSQCIYFYRAAKSLVFAHTMRIFQESSLRNTL